MAQVAVSEDDLWFFPEFVERLEKENQSVKDAGFFKFNLADDIVGRGTSLDDIIKLYCSRVQDKVKKMFIVNWPGSNPHLFGHREFKHAESDVMDFMKKIKNPLSYIAPDTCCTRILREKGIEAVAYHFFTDVLKKIAKPPYGYSQSLSIRQSLMKGEKKLQEHNTLLKKLKGMSASDRRVIVDQSITEDKRDQLQGCECPVCHHESASEGIKGLTKSTNYFGQGILCASGVLVKSADRVLISPSFGMYSLSHTSMLNILDGNHEGVAAPSMYFTLEHSFVPIHIEDMSLYSVNYLHYGAPKLWIIIPPTAIAQLDQCLSRTSANQWQTCCRNLMNHKFHVPTIHWLVVHKIPFEWVLQKEGEGIVLCPNAAHFGFSLGCSIAEAFNFGNRSWIPYGMASQQCLCLDDAVHLDMEAVVSAFQPQLIRVCRQRRIPNVKDDKNFRKSVLLNVTLDPFSKMSSSSSIFEEEEEEKEKSNGVKFALQNLRPLQKRQLLCPMEGCGQTYNCGHKARLLRHINKHHRQDPSVSEAMDEAITKMFIVKGFKPMKQQCTICNWTISGNASQMRNHQKSKACMETKNEKLSQLQI